MRMALTGGAELAGADRLVTSDTGKLVLVKLKPYELLKLHLDERNVRRAGQH